MYLAILICGPIVGGLLAWLFGRVGKVWVRVWPLLFLLLDLGILVALWIKGVSPLTLGGHQFYTELSLPWIPVLGMSVHLALDGLSLALSLLTVFVGIVVIAAFWKSGRSHDPFFYFNLSLVLAGILGTFLAVDLFLFFLFWELMLVPTYFLIVAWGSEADDGRKRQAAGFKFFVFTQVSGLLMLVAILALYFIHGTSTGTYTFDLFALMGTKLSGTTSLLIMLGFLIAFAVKLPVVPFHSWLPDTYTEAPLPATIVLAGLMSKTGAYGLLRFVLPLFHDSAVRIAPVMLILGVVGIVYGAVLAFGQTDLKRLIAYTSVSHLGFVLVGIFSMNQIAQEGAILLMLSHGVATAGLFLAGGYVEERTGTRNLDSLGGLFSVVPKLGGTGIVFALIALGVPGSGNFLSEILVVVGTFQANLVLAIIASTGMVFSVIYALWIIQKSFHGPRPGETQSGAHGARVSGHTAAISLPALKDLSLFETALSVLMILVVFWLGIYPQPFLHLVAAVLQSFQGGIA
ncbi:MAG TPA: NADH-quinone oxidoreductase subunit M [Spirochaetia bacterium]|nr:NADH-quinone oxidoreductase subunit M [Spirochaetia bacterium]